MDKRGSCLKSRELYIMEKEAMKKMNSVVQGGGGSWHNGGSIQGPSQTSRYHITVVFEPFEGFLLLGPTWCRETLVSRTVVLEIAGADKNPDRNWGIFQLFFTAKYST